MFNAQTPILDHESMPLFLRAHARARFQPTPVSPGTLKFASILSETDNTGGSKLRAN